MTLLPEGLYGYQHLLSKPTHNLFWKSCQAPGTLGAHTASSNKIIPRTDMTTWKQQDSATAPIRIRQHPAQCPVLRLFPRLSQILQRERRSCYLRDCLIQGSPPLCGSLGTWNMPVWMEMYCECNSHPGFWRLSTHPTPPPKKVNWYSLYKEQHGGSLKKKETWNQNFHMTQRSRF